MGMSKCEQSPGEKQQGIFSRVMPEGHNYGLISYNKASFPPIKHNPTVPAVCSMAGTETVPYCWHRGQTTVLLTTSPLWIQGRALAVAVKT